MPHFEPDDYSQEFPDYDGSPVSPDKRHHDWKRTTKGNVKAQNARYYARNLEKRKRQMREYMRKKRQCET